MQTLLQEPQFRLSLRGSTQVLEQSRLPVGQEVVQVPATQVWPPPQTVPQPPQFEVSVESTTHALPQVVSPEGQATCSAVELPELQAARARAAKIDTETLRMR